MVLGTTAPRTNVSLDPADYRCTLDLQLRFHDLDGMGHINNAVYFTYFEVGRRAYLDAMDYPDDSVGEIGERFPFIMAEISCRFLAPVTLDDALRVSLSIDRLGNRSFGFEYLIWSGPEAEPKPMATGRSAQVFYDYARQCSMAAPDWFIEQVEKFEGRSLRG
jgi:acyl-CoA thioester hydrolase